MPKTRINASFGLTHYSLLITHYFLKQTLVIIPLYLATFFLPLEPWSLLPYDHQGVSDQPNMI
ncbi:MAG: hypothetical protein F6K47_27665 [Symploca sp. SIO2E6]|nr:hypothetical protein [Symploca sp. SIO2E6]